MLGINGGAGRSRGASLHPRARERRSAIFESSNSFRIRNDRMALFYISKHNELAIYKEFKAQIQKMEKMAIRITHIDTHHNIHEIWPVAKIILTLLKEHNISSMRILNNLIKVSKFYKIVYRRMINRRIVSLKVNYSDYFGNQHEVISFLRENPSVLSSYKIECMVHPAFNNSGQVIDIIDGLDNEFYLDGRF